MRFWWICDYAKDSKVVSHDALLSALGATFAPRAIPILDDESYRAIPADSFAEMVDRFRWGDPPPHPNKFDCDDYTATFMADLRRAWATHSKCEEALAFGHAWVQFSGRTDSHRLIWQYDSGGRVNLWEPQTNRRTEAVLGAVYEVRA